MLDTISTDSSLPMEILGDKNWIPRTLLEAQMAWEDLHTRNAQIRKRFQDAHRKGVLLRSSAMREAWQS